MKPTLRHAPRRHSLPAIAAFLAAAALTSGSAAAQPASPAPRPSTRGGAPFAVEYYYKAKWGFAEEFALLFRKNHLPVLKKQIESGRILEVTAEKPRYHATEDGRWDFRVTIVFVSAEAAADGSGEAGIAKLLFPDQETFRREEQRRFDILLAHWDVPIVPAPEMAP